MSRILTTYKRPSITVLIDTAPTIDALAKLWHDIGRAGRAGKISAADKTLDRWIEACWVRVGHFIVNAQTPGEASYVFNVVRRWQKPPGIDKQLEALLARTVADMPDDVERLARAGIIIEGVSSPEQRAMAEQRRAQR